MANIYVGTYKKYTNGDLTGTWIDPSDFNSKADFIEECYEFHSDEYEPELMFQVWEGIPDKFISEHGIDYHYWDYKIGELTEEELKICEEYWDNVSEDDSPKYILDHLAYIGSPEDFVDEILSEYDLSSLPDFIEIDAEKTWENLSYSYDVTEHYIFNS